MGLICHYPHAIHIELPTFNFSTYTDISTPFIDDGIIDTNDLLKSKINVHSLNKEVVIDQNIETNNDGIFSSIVDKYKGKVIYVDFWATWCGPCLRGMKEIEPLKEDLKNSRVAFVYITDETSPVATWKNMISGIKGEYFRLSPDKAKILYSKFSISGIPHYVLVNKKGEVVDPNLHYMEFRITSTAHKNE